jgi:hypothetical protein
MNTFKTVGLFAAAITAIGITQFSLARAATNESGVYERYQRYSKAPANDFWYYHPGGPFWIYRRHSYVGLRGGVSHIHARYRWTHHAVCH